MGDFFRKFYRVEVSLFVLHDVLCDVLIRFGREIRRAILIAAHGSIVIGILMPDLRKGFGNMAGALLIGILFVSPLSLIFRMRLLLLLMGFRREVGILMAYGAGVHGIGYMLHGYDIRTMLSWTRADFIVLAPLFGFVAMMLLLPLLITSNGMAVRRLGKWWKRIHFLVYPAALLIVLHRAFIVTGREESFLLMREWEAILLVGSYGFLKLLAWRDIVPGLEKIIHAVAMRYRFYRESTRKS
jgi:sulfoxide reductase heme-binding subunit YedZ